MSFLSNVRKFFRIGDVEKKKKTYNNIRRDRDPSEIWEIVGELGDGAFGKVYKTKNKEDGSFAALKQVEIKDEEELDDYMVEIDILTEFKHKNVVGLYEAFFYNETLWMYIEFCGGGALDSIMMELEKPLTEPQIRCICHEMCEALAFLHQCGVIHRDLKAGNVLLAMDGTVRLADFGVSAKNGDPKAKRDTFIGTPFWMAPEVISCETLKENPYDSSADIWSFGITLIELAQMEPPNHEMHPMRVLMKIHKADPPTLDVQSKWSKDFNDFIRICLNKTPEGRPTASDLLKHPFIKNVTDNRPVRELIGEAKAEITEVFEDIPDETEVKVNGIDLDAEGSEDSYSMGDISESLGEVDSLKKVTEDDGDKTSIKEETITMGDEDKEEEKPDAPVAVAVVAPPEPDEVREDVVEDVVTEIVDDVIRSDQDVPSVPQVVMESFDELVQEDINAQKQNNEEPSEPVQDTDLLVTDIDTEITKLQDGEDRSEEVKVVVPSVIVTPDQPREEVHKPSTPQLDRLSNEQKSDSGSQETISSAGDTMIVVDDRQPKEQNAVTRRKDKNEQQKKEVKVSFGIALPHKTPTMQAKSQYRTLTKTRKYIVDGVIVTSTTSKVVLVGEENRTKEEFENKKQDLRELKVLQKQENKAYQDLVLKAQYMRQQEERRYDLEMQALLRSFEADIEALNKQQKQQVEKAEITQGLDLKLASKKIKQDQDREVRMFHETLKQEQKLLKQEVDMMPKDQRKDVLRRRREEKDIEHQERERHFLEQQQESFDKKMKRLSDQHREKIALLEKQFLQQKQQLLRAREAAIWEMEERHQHEKHQLAKRQLKDMFFLKRHQMLTRHDKELAQIKRINGRKEEELLRRQAIEKKRMPKIQKGEMKTRAQIFKQSLRISMVINADEERDKIRQFEENEKKRVKAEQLRQELKHKKQWDELTNKNMTQLRELEQLQAEKRKMLMEQETQKIQELDDHYENELVEWRSKLQPRKQQLEEEFARQREKQEKFYGGTIPNGGAANLTPNEMRRLNSTSGSRASTVL
ncbi:serine/threonine-protein kinase 10-like isoform X4 [Lineus longissimus]|uniref:serine/threonine-protein kinase 10-like isoform X4 n=1 Tax=Lineus longissimus TaxID=88925 RepID=UPI002B4F0A43